MSKAKTIFSCQKCGAQRPKWEGRCSDCGSWGTLQEEVAVEERRGASGGGGGRGWSIGAESDARPYTLAEAAANAAGGTDQVGRLASGLTEIDRVLGGGIVPGSLILMGGDPGIGKSTLVLQISGKLGSRGRAVLYASGEESVAQTAMRAKRLGVSGEQLSLLAESNLEKILEIAAQSKPAMLVVDSIQTIYLPHIQSCPGSVSQVRECAGRLMMLAKEKGIAVLLIGHVTKEGNIAGPKTLEHMVDTVLSFEGDNNHQFRLLRVNKNRFGATHELGVFQMGSGGLEEVPNPSEFFLEERGHGLFGSAIMATMEGSRPLLCEVQALVTRTALPMPRRTALGFDSNRVHLLAAVLEKYLGAKLSEADIFVNVVGGLHLHEPAADLAVAASLLSSARSVALNPKSCLFGEIGLTGEVRAVSMPELRIHEAQRLGFTTFFLPEANRKHLADFAAQPGSMVHWISSVKDLDHKLRAGAKKEERRGDQAAVMVPVPDSLPLADPPPFDLY